MGNTPAVAKPVSPLSQISVKPSAPTVNVTVTLSPGMQQRLISINAPVFATVGALKDLGLLDASAALDSGKALAPVKVTLSEAAAKHLCQSLSRIPATDSMAAEVGTLMSAIPQAFRVAYPRPSVRTPKTK